MPTPYDNLNTDLSQAVLAFAQSIRDKLDNLPAQPLLTYVDGLNSTGTGYLKRMPQVDQTPAYWTLESIQAGLTDGNKGDVTVGGSGTTLTLNNTGVVAGNYGSSTTVPYITVDSKGRIVNLTDINIRPGTTAQTGIVRLNDSTADTSTTDAATPNAVRRAYDLAATAIQSTEKGVANGVATLDSNGFIVISQIPTAIDDIQEYASTAAFPATGVENVIYLAISPNNRMYRWSGSVYVAISSGPVADEALKLTSPRSITASGDLTWTVNFDGSQNVTAAATLTSTGVVAGTYRSITVDEKGRATAGTNPTTIAGYGLTDAAKTDGSNAAGNWPIDIQGKANNLKKVLVTTQESGLNEYLKIARVTLNTVGSALRVALMSTMRQQLNYPQVEIIHFNAQQISNFGFAPHCSSEVTKISGATHSKIGYVIVQNTPVTIVDFYMFSPSQFTTYDAVELTYYSSGDASVIYYQNELWSATPPGGLQGPFRTNQMLTWGDSTSNNQIFYSDANGWTGTTLSAAARTLLDDADVATMRTTLGLGSAATSASTAFQAASTGLSNFNTLIANASTGIIRKTAADTFSLDNSVYLTANQSITYTGDATGSGTTSVALTLANSGVTAGTYPKVTVDAKGRVTVGSALAASDIPNLDTAKITTGTFAASFLPSATTAAVGVVQLNSATNSTSTTQAATASAVKAAYDLANTANTTASAAIPASQKGAANGVAPLDANGKVPVANLPNTGGNGLSYLGTWNPATNSPTLTSTPASAGSYYVVAGGSATFLSEDYNPKDWIISDGTNWSKVDNTDNVTSVAGKSGAITLVKADVGLGNVDNTSDANKPVSTLQQTALDTKVDKIGGKGLSTEDYSTAEKTKLSGIAAGAQVNPAIASTVTAKAGTDNVEMITSANLMAALTQGGYWDYAVVYSDFNAVPVGKTHFIRSTDTTANRPTADSREYVGVALWHGSNSCRQVVWCANTGVKAMYYRNGNGASMIWDASWTQIYDSSNLILQLTGQDLTANAVLRNGAWTLGSQTLYNQFSQSLAATTWTALSAYAGGQTTLQNGWVYKIHLTVSGVSTSNAGTFMVTQSASNVFVARRYGQQLPAGVNQPDLRIAASNNTIEIYQSNSTTQTVQVYIEAYFSGNITITNPSWFGIEGFLQRNATGGLLVDRSGTMRNIWDETTLVKQSSMYDVTAGSVLTVGAYGRGATTVVAQANADTITVSGDYAVGTTWTGSPFPAADSRNAGTLSHSVTDAATEATQRFVSEAVGEIDLVRVKRASVWGSWSRQWNTSNLTVSSTAPSSPYIGQLWVDTSGT